jgi:hypothetical protein
MVDSAPEDQPPPDEQPASASKAEPEHVPPHPIAAAVDTFSHKVRDIQVAARVHVPLSRQRKVARLNDIKKELTEASALLKSGDANVRAHAISRVLTSVRRLDRLARSAVPQALTTSLFLGLFSAYDAFTGELLSALYRKRPELFKKLKRSVEVGQILRYRSFAELQEKVLQDEIESFRRKSYVEQFGELEATFGITLRAFDKWPAFVECGQRRNLITHCDGVVSEQYLHICREQKVTLDQELVVGSKIPLTSKYLVEACELILEVGAKLAHTLWRKVFPEELEQADRHLQRIAYESLQDERWARAAVFAEFAATQKRMAKDLDRRISVVNWAIALRFGGNQAAAQQVLSREDWSASLEEFRLAVHVLNDRFSEAAQIMRQIGPKGELLSEEDYHTWPLFRDFRGNQDFLDAYQAVYDRPFIDQVSKVAADAQATPTLSTESESGPDATERRDNASETTGQELALPSDGAASAGDNVESSRDVDPPPDFDSPPQPGNN